MFPTRPEQTLRRHLLRATIGLLVGLVWLFGAVALTSSPASAQQSTEQVTCLTVMRFSGGEAPFQLVEMSGQFGALRVKTLFDIPNGETSLQGGALREAFGYYYVNPERFVGEVIAPQPDLDIVKQFRVDEYANTDGMTFVGTDDAIAANDVLYVAIRSPGPVNDQLQAVDPASGETLGRPIDIDVGSLGPAGSIGQNDLTAIAWDPGTDFIYAVAGRGEATSLVRIDLNGGLQYVRSLEGTNGPITGLSFDGQGRLIGSSWDNGVGRLVVIERNSTGLREIGAFDVHEGMQSLSCTSDTPLAAPARAREPTCQNGKGIVRVDVTNGFGTVTYEVTAIGRLTGFTATKELTLGEGESGFVGFSGRPDEVYRFEVVRGGGATWSLGVLDGLVTGPPASVGSELPGATVHCGADDLVIVANECVNGTGAVYVSVRNSLPSPQRYQLRMWYETAVLDRPGSQIPKAMSLAVGERQTHGVGGRSQDIGVLVEGRRIPPEATNGWTDGIAAGSGTVLVDCQGEPNRFGALSSCLEQNGRLDMFVYNPTDGALQYVVQWLEIDGPFRRNDYYTIQPGERIRATLTGRNDGVFKVTVRPTRLTEDPPPGVSVPPDGPAEFTTELPVSCDPAPTVEVTLRTTCLSGAGRIDVGLGNVTPNEQTYNIEVMDGNLGPRSLTLAPAKRGVVTYTGRSNSSIRVIVKRGDEVVYDRTTRPQC